MISDLKQLLDDYYGESRDDDHKMEIIAFIESYGNDLVDVLKAHGYDEGD